MAWSEGRTSISASGSSAASGERGDGDRRRGVASERLENGGARRDPALPELLGDDEAVLVIGDDQRRGEARPVRDAKRRLLQQACCAETSGSSCFGYCARDIGQSRVPEPPERITGWIRAVLAFIAARFPPSSVRPGY